MLREAAAPINYAAGNADGSVAEWVRSHVKDEIRRVASNGGSERRDVDGLAGLGALRHCVRELHVADAVLEVRVGHLLAPPDGVDELFLHPPAHALLGGDGDLAQLLVRPPAAGEAL